MAAPTFTQYLSGFRSISGILVTIGVLLPGFAYFSKYTPPFFSGIALLTAAIATATILITFYYRAQPITNQEGKLPPLIRKAVKALIISVSLLILYLILLDLCTVLVPGTENRIQIGFDKFDWSLTDYGKNTVKAGRPLATPEQWLFDESYETGAAKLIWKPWTIYLSGTLMIAVFMFAFTLWAFGWSLIAKQKSSDTTQPQINEIEPTAVREDLDEPGTGLAQIRPEDASHRQQLRVLRKQMDATMNDDEIETLAFDLGVDYENLKGDTKEAKARELVLYCDRTGKLSDLIELCRALRPNWTWNVL